MLLPNIAPNSPLPPLWDPHYEPLWELCEELDVVCNIHTGSGLPDFGEHEAARAIMLIEIAWFAHRGVWHLIFGGVLERHPNLRVVLTEQGTSWIPRGLDTLDWFHRRMTHGGAAEAVFFGAVAKQMSLTPTEYFQRNFWVGASFLRPSESVLRYEIGVDRIMWGADYPHSEGQLSVHDRGIACRVRAVPAGRDEGDGRDDRCRRVRLRSRRRCAWSAIASARRSRRCRCRSIPATIPPTRPATHSTRNKSSRPGSDCRTATATEIGASDGDDSIRGASAGAISATARSRR